MLSEKISVLENKHRFVQEVRESMAPRKHDTVSTPERPFLDLSICGETAIEERLKSLGYPTHNGSFDYLLSMAARSFTADKAERLAFELSETQEKRAALEIKTTKELWMDDLAELEPLL
jgi:hypothetical protein